MTADLGELDDPAGEQLERERHQREFARRLAQHLSRAQVTAVLRARKAGYAYPGRHSLGSALVTERTIATLREPGVVVLDANLALTDLGQHVAVVLVAEAGRYLS